jgi:comEA protein
MNLRALVKNISFTKNEMKVIIFIITVLVVGFSIKYYKYVAAGSDAYDFTQSDAEFKKRSMLIYSGGSDTIEEFTPEEKELLERIQQDENEQQDERSYFKQRNRIELTEKSININTASREELERLPGIGETIAERIIVYRQQNPKGFRKIEDIMKVKGIGQKKFDKMKIYLTVE